MEEEWKDIKGYEGYYKISNLGRVKSLYRVVRKKNGCTMTVYPRILRSGVNSNGYLDVSLLKDAHSKTFLVHILVATAFYLILTTSRSFIIGMVIRLIVM